MSRRSSSLNNYTGTGITREIDSKYDVIKNVSDKLTEIEAVATEDLDALVLALNEAKDFTGITVVTGSPASWDAASKTLTVPTLQGEQGVQGIQGEVGPIGPTGARGAKGDRGVEGAKGDTGATGLQGVQGPAGEKGVKGDTGAQGVKGDTGPVGPAGLDGSKGDKGDQGIGVHHIKGTNTTDPEGDFATAGETDTYTMYGDAGETQVVGHFEVTNGIQGILSFTDYYKQIVLRTGDSGTVLTTNAQTLLDAVNELDSDKLEVTGGIISGNLEVVGDFTVSGTTTTVNSETVSAADNLIVINAGEVGSGVTKGLAGIEVDRGSSNSYQFLFDESDDSFKVGEPESLQKVATREDNPLNSGIATWDSAGYRFATSRDIDVDNITISGTVDGRDVSVDGAKLDTVEVGATADQTDVEIKAAYDREYVGRVGSNYIDSAVDIDSVVDTLDVQLKVEEQARIAKDAALDVDVASLNTALATEESARLGEDALLQEQIEGNDVDIATVVQSVLNLSKSNAKGQFGDNGTMDVSLSSGFQVLPVEVKVQSTNTDTFEINGDGSITVKEPGEYTFLSTVVFEDSGANGSVGNVTFQIMDTTTNVAYYAESTTVEIGSYDRETIPFNSLVIADDSLTYPVTANIRANITGVGTGDYHIVGLESVISSTSNVGDITQNHNELVNRNVAEAHDASSISYSNASSGLAAIDIQTAVDEVEGRLDTTESKLSGIEAGATADQTANEILTAIKTIDGVGSGLDADTVDGNQPGTAYTEDVTTSSTDTTAGRLLKVGDFGQGTFIKNYDLSSQIQKTAYKKSVIALCELTNDVASFDSYSSGEIVFHRSNSLVPEITAKIQIAKNYNSTKPNAYLEILADSLGTYPDVKICTFMYNGVKYGGLHFHYDAPEHNTVIAKLSSNFTPFGVDYYNTQTALPTNTEINDSLSLTDYGRVIQGVSYHTGNDGAGSGMDADLLDGQQGSYYQNNEVVEW